MARLTREEMKALYSLFDTFALNDQRRYYENTVDKFRKAASQVNRIRGLFAFLTGLSSAAAGLIVQSSFDGNGQCLLGAQANPVVGLVNSVVGVHANCAFLQGLVLVFLLLAVITPALGGAFNILADLFQWDRLITIYDAALENIEVADSRSPDAEMDEMIYLASLHAFAEGTLTVMYDETAQWGQLIRTPPQLDKFIQDEENKAAIARGERPGTLSAPAVPAPTPPAAPVPIPTPAANTPSTLGAAAPIVPSPAPNPLPTPVIDSSLDDVKG